MCRLRRGGLCRGVYAGIYNLKSIDPCGDFTGFPVVYPDPVNGIDIRITIAARITEFQLQRVPVREAGVDGSVALVELGAGGSLDTSNIKDPIVGFVFGNKGLMYNLTLEGSKFTKLAR